MFRLIVVCAAVVLGCVLVGGYLASDNIAQSVVDVVPTKTNHVLSASSEGDSKASVETTDETADDADDTADDANSGGDDDSGAQAKSDEWTPGELPGEPGK
jgi:hypothetical protein